MFDEGLFKAFIYGFATICAVGGAIAAGAIVLCLYLLGVVKF